MRAPALLALCLGLASCAEPDPRPNVLWIVWDTVRADHMSLYGYERETTPFLDEWAREGLVFEDCLSPGSSTVPSHGSMFTGLYPTEHGANFQTKWLDDSFDTVAEELQRTGYRTYLFSANPNIQSLENFQQGFDVEEHPWDPQFRDEALAILSRKVAGRDKATGLQSQIRTGKIPDHELRAAGKLAEGALLDFLERTDGSQPYFAFLNYMEAHAPLVSEERFRKRFMTDEQVAESYEQDRSWANKWAHTYGFRELPEAWFEVYRATYDAALAELDELLSELIAALEERGELENTLVIVTSDHGEHLGDHGLIDHRHSVYQALIRVPLVLRGPGVSQGRSNAPVSTLDLHRTVLARAGVRASSRETHDLLAPSLDATLDGRERLAEYPDDFPVPSKDVYFMENGTDLSAWRKTLHALVVGGEKVIVGSDGTLELYALDQDQHEQHDLAGEGGRAAPLRARLDELARALKPFAPSSDSRELPDEFLEQLEVLGYAEDADGE